MPSSIPTDRAKNAAAKYTTKHTGKLIHTLRLTIENLAHVNTDKSGIATKEEKKPTRSRIPTAEPTRSVRLPARKIKIKQTIQYWRTSLESRKDAMADMKTPKTSTIVSTRSMIT